MKDYTTKLRKLRADRLLYSGVALVVQGEWVYSEHDIPHCSECGFEPKCILPYCPNCGAKMEEDTDVDTD